MAPQQDEFYQEGGNNQDADDQFEEAQNQDDSMEVEYDHDNQYNTDSDRNENWSRNVNNNYDMENYDQIHNQNQDMVTIDPTTGDPGNYAPQDAHYMQDTGGNNTGVVPGMHA